MRNSATKQDTPGVGPGQGAGMAVGSGQAPVTQLLERARLGEAGAMDAAYAAVYEELKRAAHLQLRREHRAFDTTVLVHEAYLKLDGQALDVSQRGSFLALAAKAMRHVLIDHVRARGAEKRGGDQVRVTLSTDLPLAGQAGGEDAVAGKALGEIHVRREPAEVRGAIQRDIDVATPHIFDFHVSQLREYAAHAPGHGAAQVGWGQGGIAGTAAEQQAMVAAQAEVVQRPVGVGHRHVVADQGARAFLAQRRGGGDVGAHRHHPRFEFRRDPAQQRVAGIEYLWGGMIDISLNRAPHWGRLAPNLYFAQGFSGHGLIAAGVAGTTLAQAIRGQSEGLDLFAKIDHRPFPGGRALRTPLLVAAMAWYKLRDALW